MDLELESVYDKIMTAVSAEDVFGVTDVMLHPDELLEYLAVEYDKLHQVTDPDKWSEVDDLEMAQDADYKLKQLYRKAQERIREGLYGLGGLRIFSKGLPSFSTSKRKYYLGDVLEEGEIATIYTGYCEIGDESAGEVAIKLIDDSADNDLAQNEIRILRLLHEKKAPQWKHLPFLLDTFQTDGRTGLVLRKINGFDLLQVRDHKRYRKGVDRKHMVWMLNRILSLYGFAHSLGIVNCNIEPSHFMFRPVDHNGWAIDWSYAAYRPEQTGDCFRVHTPIFSAPEVEKKLPPIPASDIYSIGKVMIWLLGGNPETNEMPDKVEEELQRFLLGFVMESPIQRPDDAWGLHDELIRLVEGLWGKRKFLQFLMD
jgi:serine/threonine protein kinase